MATLKHIAQSLNLSVMAVSKALRDAPDIGAATKERVRKEAKRLGYVPNHLARSLRGGSSQLLGVLFPTINDSYASNILSGIEQEATARGYHVLVSSSHHNPALEMDSVVKMLERQVEALFVLPLVRLQHRSPLLDLAAQHKLPLIFLHHYPADAAQYENVGWVIDDALKGSEMVTRHLIEAGHKELLYFSGPPTASASSDHMTGHNRALKAARLPIRTEAFFLAGVDIDGGKQAMVRALAEKVPFTGIVCVNDAVAMGAIHILKQHGYKVPQDVSVVGYGDGVMAAHAFVPLTTVRQPQVDLGRAAFNLWFQSKKGEEKLRTKILPVELIVRESSAAVEKINAPS